jgi:hypothetical protein
MQGLLPECRSGKAETHMDTRAADQIRYQNGYPIGYPIGYRVSQRDIRLNILWISDRTTWISFLISNTGPTGYQEGHLFGYAYGYQL